MCKPLKKEDTPVHHQTRELAFSHSFSELIYNSTEACKYNVLNHLSIQGGEKMFSFTSDYPNSVNILPTCYE